MCVTGVPWLLLLWEQLCLADACEESRQSAVVQAHGDITLFRESDCDYRVCASCVSQPQRHFWRQPGPAQVSNWLASSVLQSLECNPPSILSQVLR